MLYAAVAFVLAVASGVQAQCVGQSNNVAYDFCGTFGPINFYWTPRVAEGEMPAQTNILFEMLDNGWYAFGFAQQVTAAMVGANVIFGCDDFPLDAVQAASGIPALAASPWDAVLLARDVPGVAAGFNANNLAIPNTISIMREDGICGIRFERLNVLNNGDVDEAQDIVSGVNNTFVIAMGDAAVPGIHSARMIGMQDFILNTGDISANPIVPLVPATTTAPGVTQAPDGGSASVASLSAILVGAVAALTAALWQ